MQKYAKKTVRICAGRKPAVTHRDGGGHHGNYGVQRTSLLNAIADVSSLIKIKNTKKLYYKKYNSKIASCLFLQYCASLLSPNTADVYNLYCDDKELIGTFLEGAGKGGGPAGHCWYKLTTELTSTKCVFLPEDLLDWLGGGGGGGGVGGFFSKRQVTFLAYCRHASH